MITILGGSLDNSKPLVYILTMIKRNINGMDFRFCSNVWREYYFGNQVYSIDRPRWIHVKENGTHIVIDEYGITHVIPNNYHVIRFKNPNGTPEVDYA